MDNTNTYSGGTINNYFDTLLFFEKDNYRVGDHRKANDIITFLINNGIDYRVNFNRSGWAIPVIEDKDLNFVRLIFPDINFVQGVYTTYIDREHD